jgi:general secretion pathway protein H
MMRARDHQRRRATAGFTLIELLVALSLLALAVFLALPSARGPATSQMLDATAQDIAGLLRAARSAAIKDNQPRRLIVDVAQRSVGPEAGNGGGDAIAHRRLPAGFELDVTAASGDIIAPSAIRLTFFPDGSASGGRIVLRHAGRSAAISIDWLSGRVTAEIGAPS